MTDGKISIKEASSIVLTLVANDLRDAIATASFARLKDLSEQLTYIRQPIMDELELRRAERLRQGELD